jgi:hypothetical protein
MKLERFDSRHVNCEVTPYWFQLCGTTAESYAGIQQGHSMWCGREAPKVQALTHNRAEAPHKKNTEKT